ncbi:hypothetical protein WJ96_05465 [Burkholderia ubonensis]|uniref:Uncharacterized protein n=2 Tax=Burkholderia ubonensis TaxID=101571 RepID=A0AAW3MSX7_9BURK|nr:hypothetical protein WJ97_12395 [Burkholderia ubonensis]KVP98019.1 hypothetical protein WJ96_05465 [Burkholderia ubonensis]KVZ92716.1 hypothetical protein WL25_17125 [Burkholderia ubonensis]
MLPHLILKRLQAEIAIRWHKSRPKLTRNAKGQIQSHAPEQQAFDETIAELLRVLKRRDADAVIQANPVLTVAANQLGVSKIDGLCI